MDSLQNLRGKKVLITGHTGFTGNWLVGMLSKLGCDLYGISDRPSGVTNLFNQNQLESLCHSTFAKVENLVEFRNLVDEIQPDLIFHLAAQPLVLEGYKNPLQTFLVNSMGTASVIDAALATTSVKAVIGITSDKVYEMSHEVHTEESRLGGNDPYSSSKVAAEAIARGYQFLFRQAGKKLVTLRGGNIFGGGDWSPNRIVPDLYRAMQSNSTVTLRNPSSVRPWQHVLDLCFGYVMVASHALASDRTISESYNIGPNPKENASVEHLVKMFSKSGVNYTVESSHLPETEKLSISSARIGDEVGWRPNLNLASSVALTESWYRGVLVNGDKPIDVTSRQIEDFLNKFAFTH
jgi:CDP-glucose 4,6-dehydratase